MRKRGVTAALAGLALLLSACRLNPVDLESAKPLALRTEIVDADGDTLAWLYRENRYEVELDDLPAHTVDAILAAEDHRFYRHNGYDIRAMARAALVNLREGEVVQGGSTITQQYVDNSYFRRPSRTLTRKARELRYAIEVEKTMTKNEILEGYVNTVYFGEGAYGIGAASENYFDKAPQQLSLSESALLAGIIRAPSAENPRDHKKRALARMSYVLGRMVELGMITADEAREARIARMRIVPDPPRLALREPYFVEAVKREVMLDRRFGRDPDERAQALFKGGLEIRTTLRTDLQRYATRAIDSVLNQPGDPEAALVAIEPRTGHVVAMIGGRDWKASQVNLALGKAGGGSGRQPGSSFKTLVAAAALESDIPLESRYESGGIRVTLPGGEVWSVASSDRGLTSLHEGLVASVNGVYARAALQIGAGRIASQAELMGVRTRLPEVPSIALGSSEVSVMDMAAAYSTIANDGVAIEPTTISEIRFPNGDVLEAEQETIPQAMSPGNAYLLTKALEDVVTRGTGTNARIGRPAAGKTGTTNDYGDAWFVGFTPQLVTAVWVGYPQGRIPMTNVHGGVVEGGSLPASIWREFMSRAHEGLPVKEFEIPDSALVTVRIDPDTGLLEAPWCPGKKVQMLRELAPRELCPRPIAPAPPEVIVVPSPSFSPSPTDKGKRDEGRGKGDGADPEPSEEPSPKPEPKPSKKN